ncbi:unnamed protein product [Closterium sp. NIES-53]
MTDAKDGFSLFDYVSGTAVAPADTAPALDRSQWQTHDAAARLTIRNHLPITARTHFSQHKTAKALTSSLTYALVTLVFVPPFQDHFLALDPHSLTVDDLETHLLAAEKNILAVGAARVRSTAAPEEARVAGMADVVLEGAVVEAGGGGGGGGGGRGGGGSGGGGGGAGSSGGGGGGGGGGGSSGGEMVGAWVNPVVARDSSSSRSRSSSSVSAKPSLPSSFLTGPRTGRQCTRFHTEYRCFARLSDAWCVKFPDATEFPNWADLLRRDEPIYDLDYDAILAAMYALTVSAEGDCYLCVPPDPGISPGIAPAALAACESTLPGTESAQALHTFTLDSGASRCFFRKSTTVTPLPTPVPVSLADPSGGPVLARSSTVLPCPAVPSGELSGLHLPSFSTKLVSNAVLQDHWVDTFTPGGQRVAICTCSRTGRHLATFTRAPGSSLYTLTTTPCYVPLSPQLSASAPVATQCECRRLLHATLLWHHRLGHPSLPRLRSMHSRFLVSGLPRSLPALPPSPAPPCIPCVEGRQRAAPHSSLFPPTEAPLQTLHLDVWGPARVQGQGRERYFLLVVDDYTRYTTVFPLQRKGDVPAVLIPWIRAVRLQLRERFHLDFPVLRLHSNRGGEFSSDVLAAFCAEHGIRQTFTLPASPQQNGVAEHRIGLVMEVARTSMIHAAAPHFLWPFAVRYAAHQLNLWPRVSLPETSPTLLWMGKVGDAFTTPPRAVSPAPSGVSQVDPPVPAPLEVTGDSGPAGGGPARGTVSGGAELRGAEPECEEPGGAEPGGAALEHEEPGGAELGSTEPGGAEPEREEPGGTEPEREDPGVAAFVRVCLSPHSSCTTGTVASGARGSTAGGSGATGLGGARTRGTGAAGPGGAAGAAAGAGATGGAAAGAAGAGASAGGAGAVPAGSGGAERPRPYFVLLLEQVLGLPPSTGPALSLAYPPHVLSPSQLQPASPLSDPSPYTGPTGGLAECREPASRPALPIRAARTSGRGSRPPPVPGMHQMTLRPSTAPQRVPLPSSPESSLPALADPKSDSLRAASPTVTRLLATVVTDPSFESAAASALVAELLDFAARCRLDYAASLVAESESVCPPSVRGECALGTDVLEDRQEEFQCLAAASLHLVSMLLAHEGDPDALDIPTPRFYAEAIEGPYSSQWQAAMDTEMASWKSTSTYVDEVRPPGANIVDGMWIFRVKRPPGSPPVFKARYVARGFSQGQGLHRPPGFTGSFPAGTEWSLRRPVYGLFQAPREWHDTLRTTLAALGFAPSTADPSLFLRTDTLLPPFYILVYVDDLVFATADTEALTLVKSELQKRHTCIDLGELRSYLGLQITRDRARRTITLTQSHMVHQVLQRFDFQYSLPQSTPLPTGHSLSAPPSDGSVQPSGPYPELVGCLMYLMTCTRPDLAYPLSILARYVAPGRHRQEHWKAAKRVMRYLCNTSGMGLVLGGRGPVVLSGHADASWVDDLASQWSSQGYTFSLGSGSVSWRSTHSSSVLSSSCEAEIYATAMAAQELRWLTYLLTDLGEAPRSPPVLYVDNKAAIALCQEHRLEHRTKLIALRYFLAQELQQPGQLHLAHVATRANTADLFTKALPSGDHQCFCALLGLVPTFPHLM